MIFRFKKLDCFLPQTHWIYPHAPDAHKAEVFKLGPAHSELVTDYLDTAFPGYYFCMIWKEEVGWAVYS